MPIEVSGIIRIEKMASFTAKDATFCISPLIDTDERNK